MKAVIQRVIQAKVTESETGKVVGQIQKGLFVLVGVKKGDSNQSAILLSTKLKKLRIFEEIQGKMTTSVLDSNLPILVVSQFTLLADTTGGNRPSFLDAEKPERAKRLYEFFVSELSKDLTVETGSFGKYMKIDLKLDGPVTIVMET